MQQRQHPRFPVRFKSSFRSANVVSGEGTLGDLSIRGCRIVSAADVRVGTVLELGIDVGGDTPPVHVDQAVARWSRGADFGVEFTSLAPDEWVRLRQIIKQLEQEPYQTTAQASQGAEP